jgi:uncharacterized protein (DUF362 family)
VLSAIIDRQAVSSLRPALRTTSVGMAFLSGSASPYADETRVRTVVRRALFAAGLGRTSAEAPLRDVIAPGAKVLLKPNWVHHLNIGGHQGDCLVTHPAVIRAVIAEVLLAGPAQIIVGDAPIQDCRFDCVVDPAFRDSCQALTNGVPLSFVDFRRTILTDTDLSSGVHENMRPEEHFVLFDLGSDSLLEPITTARANFRVTKYDPRRLAARHHAGCHQYLLAREAFEADVVISIPKLKMHGKAGLTGALKNLVGMNGNKDYLPHHRVGGSVWGGDCYPGFAPLKRIGEAFLDDANRNIGSPAYRRQIGHASQVLRLHTRITGEDGSVEGMWHGNDTCWRMVGDLNRILRYGRIDGSMSRTPQRTVYTLTDAIVCGEGEGPLAPEPIFCGAVTFADNPVAADLCHAALLRLDPAKIPLLRGLQEAAVWPLHANGHARFCVDAQQMSLAEIGEVHGVNARPPRGWVGHCEWSELR